MTVLGSKLTNNKNRSRVNKVSRRPFQGQNLAVRSFDVLFDRSYHLYCDIAVQSQQYCRFHAATVTFVVSWSLFTEGFGKGVGSRGNYSSTAVYWCVYHWCDTQRNERGVLHVHVIIVYMCNRPWYTMQYLACQSDSSRRQRKYCMLNVPMCTISSLRCRYKFFHAWH